MSKVSDPTPKKSSSKRVADDQMTPESNKKAKPGLSRGKSRVFSDDAPLVIPGIKMPKKLAGGVETKDVIAKFGQINTYNGLMQDLAGEHPTLAEWVAVAMAWSRAKGALECSDVDKRLSPWWCATEKERKKALSIHFSCPPPLSLTLPALRRA